MSLTINYVKEHAEKRSFFFEKVRPMELLHKPTLPGTSVMDLHQDAKPRQMQ
jgi:hypothetical protein